MAELERSFKRGGIYWVKSVDGWGSVTSAGRPAVIVTSQFGIDHSPIVSVLYLTTQFKSMSCNVDIQSSGKPSQVQCNQITTVDKALLGVKQGEVTEAEMARIDDALAMCLGLTLHKREVDEALEAEKTRVAALEEELMAKRVEVAMAEKMYEKALEMLAGVRLTNDLQTPVQRKVEPPKPRVPRIVPDEPEVDEEIENRETVSDKVNVNTASAQELREKTGIPLNVAYGITAHRKRNGEYRSLEELLDAPRFEQCHLDRYGGKLTV